MKRDLAWFEAKALGFPGLTIEEAEAGWPKTLRPVSLAKLQRPYTILASEGYFRCEVMRKALDAACRDAAIERFATVDFEEYARRFFENQFTPQAFLAWLAKQGEPPSKHIVAWAKANGVSVPDAPKAGLVQGAASAQGEAVTAAPATGAALVQPAAAPPRIVKRAVLVAELKGDWGTIERDLSDAARKGLKAAAGTDKHGYWRVEAARQWAAENHKLGTAPKQTAGVTGFWPPEQTRRHSSA